MAIIINRSIRSSLPETSVLLAEAWEALKAPSNCDIRHHYVGGLHNISFRDKMKWAQDGDGPFIVEEKGSGRCEYYPLQRSMRKSGYSISMLSFEHLGPKKKPVIRSHYRYYDTHYPQPAIRYTSGFMGQSSTTDLLVFTKDGRLHSPDFAFSKLGAHTGLRATAHDCSLFCTSYIRIFNAHDYLDQIVFSSYREIWEHDKYRETQFDSLQIILKNPKQQRDGDPTSFQWITQNCKGDFHPMEDEPFESERDEFNFLTDFAL